jgi:hypothetical protein
MAINFPNSPNLYDVAEVGNNFYIWNDERARIKKEINEITNSSFKEVNIY